MRATKPPNPASRTVLHAVNSLRDESPSQRGSPIPLLRALSDPTRLGLIQCLLQGEMCVGELTRAMGMRQPRISHHLGILRRLELVQDRRAGKKIYYRLHPRRRVDGSTSRLDLGPLQVEFRSQI
jgi:DNA-binding transcriptional ArsR family regulator